MAEVIIPHVGGMLYDDTVLALLADRQRFHTWQLDQEDPGAYGRLLRLLWAHGETFVIVEQDVVPAPGMVGRLTACPELWCCQRYADGYTQAFPHLGLTKFDKALLSKWPMAADRALLTGKYGSDQVAWKWVGDAIIRDLTVRGVAAHEHTPGVRHLHELP